ncbi:MAG: Holliday junction resolvase RuvX [Prochlorothrix sp.]|nr:Holliday junction resolvase RuvX [Prochlorothrix sp.]
MAVSPETSPPRCETPSKTAKQRVAALGLDIGRKRVGIAGCDGLGLIATGLTTLHRKSFAQDLATLRPLIEERQVDLLVVGLPVLADGKLGTQAKETRNYAKRLSKALGLPVAYVDERCTSLAAKALIRESGRSPSAHKGLIDRKAAAIILQQWLDDRRLADCDRVPTAVPTGD